MNWIPKTAAVGCLAIAVSCSEQSPEIPESAPEPIEEIVSKPLAPESVGASATLFTSLSTEETGVEMVHPLDTAHPLKRLYAFGYATGGVAIGDVNGDEKLDLFISGGPVTNRLYLQTERMRFVDASESAGIGGGEHWGYRRCAR